LSYYNPDKLVAKFWNRVPFLDAIKQKLDLTKTCFDDCGQVEFEEHFKYKYMLVMEGETTPWARPCWQLLGGFVILWQASPQHQWFHDELVPWVHYVPIKHDLSNLLDMIDWLR